MKIKTAALASCLVLFTACSNEVKDETIKTFQQTINSEFDKMTKEINNPRLQIDFSPFACKADKEFIFCENQGMSFINKEENLLAVKIKNIQLKTNEYYDGKEKGFINLKQFWDNVFQRDKKAETHFLIKGVSTSQQYSAQIKEGLEKDLTRSNVDPKIINYLKKFVDDESNYEFSRLATKNENSITANANFKIYNSRNNFKIDMDIKNATFNPDIFKVFDDANITFDTQTQNINKESFDKILANSDKSMIFISNLFNYINLDTANINIELDTENLFNGYVNMAKGYLQTLSEPVFAPLKERILNAIDYGTKDKNYKLELQAQFKKDLLLKDYKNINALEKITLNG
uniref:JlpA family lipoprotein adhesin n=1 Tax=Campylobacter jejuni TaxID=197 RepID=UPI000577084C